MTKRLILTLTLTLFACSAPVQQFDLLIRGGTVYDGLGGPGVVTDVGIRGDRVAAIGDLSGAHGAEVVDATGLAVAPGFINMLSHTSDALRVDGRSQSDIRQGVTLEVFGEGVSGGPLNLTMREGMLARQDDFHYDIDWTTLGEFLDSLVRHGISPNIASSVGATTVRIHEIGYQDRPPTDEELERMRGLVEVAMREGAVGLSTSLIYAPSFYASTEELVALAAVAARYDGLYLSHMRSEGNRFIEALDELLHISRETGIRAEVFHLKASGRDNWPKLDDAVARIEAARRDGLAITADMYTYTAGSTGLDAAMPPWVQEGGYDAWAERLRDPQIRARVAKEMTTPSDEWENILLASGPEKALLVGFRNPDLRHLTGRTLAEVAAERGTSPHETAMDLVIEDTSRVQVVYFLMSEDNVRRQVSLPWVSFGSDAASMAPEGRFLETSTHPRAYGNFARLLGHYVRDEGLLPLAEAIRKLTSLPAENLRLRQRGRLAEGYFADVVAFDPAQIRDHATFDEPHQYATGMVHVWVNGEQVLRDGEHTGALPGRVLRGPGWSGWDDKPAAAY